MALGLFPLTFPQRSPPLTTCLTDDRVKTNHRLPLVPDLLQLPRHGLLCECRELSGQMGCRALCVLLLTAQFYAS